MTEIWKDIKGYEGRYAVSNTGKVYSHISKKILSPGNSGWAGGYDQVNLRKDGKSKAKHIHRLVAEAFIPNPENKPQVNHIDHNHHNNHVSNLEWVTAYENYRAYYSSEKYTQTIKKLKNIANQKKKGI